jgi:restriction endonuclease S subunit
VDKAWLIDSYDAFYNLAYKVAFADIITCVLFCICFCKYFSIIALFYTYYYLQTIDFQKFRTGSAHPKLSGSNLKSIKIPIPSLKKQKEIVAYCDYNCNLIKQLENEIENNKELAEQFIKGIVKNVGVDNVEEVDEENEE